MGAAVVAAVVVEVVAAVDEEEVAVKAGDQILHGLTPQSIAIHTVRADIQAGSANDQRRAINTMLPSRIRWEVRPITAPLDSSGAGLIKITT